MFLRMLQFLFKKKNNFKLIKIRHIIDHINSLEGYFSNLSDNQLKKKRKFLKML
ncbi:hypothetical protein [Buchnera aphidicola]|uniref:hypothetical protein n=1 Tax=Buchnera aphidicola TaxID=9 RepID=UPI003464D18A